MRHSILHLAFCVACASARTIEHQTVKGNPIGKVVTLLERLGKEISKEGKKEAEAYDKFACFCKEQADDKLYAITKSKEKIELMVAEIKQLDAEIKKLDEAVESDKKKKKEKVAEGKEAAEERKTAREKYEEEEEGLAKALKAIKEAIEALKESKGKMKDAKLSMVAHTPQHVLATNMTNVSGSAGGNATARSAVKQDLEDMKKGEKELLDDRKPSTAAVDALQSEEQKDKALMAAQKQIAELKAQLAKAQEKTYNGKESEAKSALTKVLALLSSGEPGKPPKYEYKSNSIIETLQTLYAQFRDNKYEVDNAETKEKQEYEMEKGARDMEIKILGELIEKNTKLSAEKSDKKATLESDRDDEQELQDKDQEFMDELTEKCQEKAEGWDKRSKKRSAELTAIKDAIDALKQGAVQNYEATTVLITKDKARQDGHDRDVGFLQLGSRVKRHFGHTKHGARKAVIKFLTDQADGLKSKQLALIAAQLRFKGDNFAKIRELIEDLIQKIKDQMEAEKEKKEFCDKELGKAVDKRDEMLAKTEEEANNIDGAKAKIVSLTDDLSEVEQQIAELYKSLNEATELREEEKTDNAQALKDAKEGLAAVKQAIKVLKEFYGEFLQVKAPGGRDGKSVEELAPEAETGEYEGKADKGKGIIGLLEVIEGDFQRTVDDTESAEEESEKAFEEQEKTINEDVDAMKKESKDKKDELDTEEANLVEAKENLKEAKTSLADSKEELSKLRPQCVDLGLTFKARQARSKEEIKALEEALDILKKYGKE